MIINERFTLSDSTKAFLRMKKPEFGYGFYGSVIYARTYSRIMENGEQEQWADTIIRVVEGLLSIRKSHYVNNKIFWNETYWQDVGERMAHAIFDMRFLPPGRGLTMALVKWLRLLEHPESH